MRKVIKNSVLVFSIVILMSSCAAYHSGYMQGSAALSSANFSYVNQNISGSATATYILGIGGLAKETLVNNAKQDMLAKNPLRNNQALSNLTVNFKRANYFLMIYSTVSCTVTADVVEFNK